MSEKAFELEQDKVKSVQLVDISTKITGVDEVNAGVQALKRLHHRAKHRKPAVKKEPVVEAAAPAKHQYHRPLKEQKASGFLGIVAYSFGRVISFISNIIK